VQTNTCLTSITQKQMIEQIVTDFTDYLAYVPDGYTVVALVPIGYPAQEAKIPARREISEFVHYDTF